MMQSSKGLTGDIMKLLLERIITEYNKFYKLNDAKLQESVTCDIMTLVLELIMEKKKKKVFCVGDYYLPVFMIYLAIY